MLWGGAQSLFVLPRGFGPDALIPAGYRPLVPPAVGVALNAVLVLLFLWWFPRRVLARGEWRRAVAFRLRPVPEGAWPALAATGAAMVAGVTASLLVLPRLLPFAPAGDPLVAAYLRQPLAPLAFAVVAVALAPLMEEFLFRGWVQGRLERAFAGRGAPGRYVGHARVRRAPVGRAPWAAIGVTALIFAAVHAQSFGFLPRLGFAVAAGYAAWRTRSIWASVALHAMYNGGLLVATPLLAVLVPRFGAADERSLARLAGDDGVFWPALAVLVLSAAAAAVALGRLGREGHGPIAAAG